MIPPKALFFDLDDTLLDSSFFADTILRTCQLLADREKSLDAAQLLEANREVWQLYFPEIENKWMLGELDGTTLIGEAWRRTLRTCDCDNESMVELARQVHLQYTSEAHRLFEDVAELFSSLKKARIPLALITNGASDTQREKLQTLNIEHWFDTIVISGEIGVAKPDIPIFTMALDQLGIAPAGAWHVGDNLKTDVAGAIAAGIGAVWLNRKGLTLTDDDPEPHLEISSLAELDSLVIPSAKPFNIYSKR